MSARKPSACRPRRTHVAVLAGMLTVFAACAPGHAQDFASARSGIASGALAMLDGGTGAPGAGLAWEAATTRWWSLPDLQTRALAASFGRRSARVALGASQTGTPELGWQSAAVALGAATPVSSVAVRGLARRDPGSVAGEPLGVEAGGGARLALSAGVQLWTSAPQLWTHGAAPPLRRPLMAGLAATGELASAWVALEGPRAGAAGERLAGVAMSAGGAQVWVEARGAPWRGAFGVEASAGPLAFAVRVESHAELGETVQLGLALRSREMRP